MTINIVSGICLFGRRATLSSAGGRRTGEATGVRTTQQRQC